MTQITKNFKDIEKFHQQHIEILHYINKKLKEVIRDKRQITYSDIINYIIKENIKGDICTQIIIWCNSNIRRGNFFIDF